MRHVEIVHRTTYNYRIPVAFGEHGLMVRPTGGFDMRLVDYRLSLNPGADVVSGFDAYGNIQETATFSALSDRLEIVSRFSVRHAPRSIELIRSQIVDGHYAPDDAAVLRNATSVRRPDPDGVVASWARDLAASAPDGDFDLMMAMTSHIARNFEYARRDEESTLDPAMTLAIGKGSCRDFACLMIEACRSLGYPARFVSGYLYDDAEDGLQGGGSTHAWAQINLDGAGWVEFDPTNDLVGGRNLIRSAVTLDPSEVCPVHGNYYGRGDDFLGMDVDVRTSSHPIRRTRTSDVPASKPADIEERTRHFV